ncbi:MAG: DUF3240 family protein [Halieaceae bacterium]|nr:DUF3240 family protein [Halieaceae bacterium]
MSEQLLVAVTSEKIREDLIDTLIGLEEISGFNLSTIDGYSRSHSEYDLQEQVAGYRRLCRLEVIHPEDQQEALLEALRGACGNSPLRYWIVPLAASGHLGQEIL